MSVPRRVQLAPVKRAPKRTANGNSDINKRAYTEFVAGTFVFAERKVRHTRGRRRRIKKTGFSTKDGRRVR